MSGQGRLPMGAAERAAPYPDRTPGPIWREAMDGALADYAAHRVDALRLRASAPGDEGAEVLARQFDALAEEAEARYRAVLAAAPLLPPEADPL